MERSTGDGAIRHRRTCIGCGRQSDKRGFHRVVRTPDGVVTFDSTGRMAGRGAYVCSEECLMSAVAKRKLAHALKCEIGRTDIDRLASALQAQIASEAR